jgi:glycosyltransferase involved in cell wall biosynthesis
MHRKLFYLLAVIIVSIGVYCHFSRHKQLVYLYDNLIWGQGDIVAQERITNLMRDRGIKVETFSSKIDLSLIKYFKEIFSNQKYFAIFQTYITDDRIGIFIPAIWNANYTYLTLLYASRDFTKDKKLTDEEICKNYFKQSYNYKDGKRNKGFLVTSYDKIDIDCPKGSPIDFVLTWYPTLPLIENKFESPENNKLFYTIGGGWDIKRRSEKYIKFLNKLGSKGYVDIFGPETVGGHFGDPTREYFKDNYKGYIKNANAILEISKKYSAILVLHADTHINFNIPSGRIFEAMATGRVIISDQNEWVKDHLGDNALYIDTTKFSDEIAAQIQSHMDWIRSNPEKAAEMGRKTYEIYATNYTLENQLDRLLKRFEGN